MENHIPYETIQSIKALTKLQNTEMIADSQCRTCKDDSGIECQCLQMLSVVYSYKMTINHPNTN